MDYKLEVIASGKRFLQIDTRKFLEHINNLVDEKAYILVDAKRSLEEEKEWQKQMACAIDREEVMKFIAWSGNEIAGISEAKRGKWSEKRNVTVGISLAKKHRGKGLGRELLQVCLKEAKKRLKPKKIMIEYVDENRIARRLYESLGFRKVCRLEGHIFHDGKFLDKIIMELKGGQPKNTRMKRHLPAQR